MKQSKLSTILVVLICVLSSLDTTLFVYPSLSYSLLSGCLILVLTIITFIREYKNRNGLDAKLSMFLIAWITYIIVFAAIRECELYRTIYIINSLIFIITLALNLEAQTVRWKHVENTILLIALFNVGYILLQFLGIVGSTNDFIKITGCNENPNSTAMYLVIAYAISINRISLGYNKKTNSIVTIIFLLSIILLRCRTAIVGCYIIAIVYGLKYFVTNKEKRKRSVLVAAFMLITISVLGGILLTKKNSTNGRMLVWKISAELIKKQPSGYGYGLFEKNYNIAQSRYFASAKREQSEINNADHVAMAYNDYMEMAVDGGIVGMAFLIMLYILSAISAYRHKDLKVLACVLAVSVMSMLNFFYSSVGVWIAFCCFISKIMDNRDGCKSIFCRYSQYGLLPIIGILSLPVAYKHVGMTVSQLKFKTLHEAIANNKVVNDKGLIDLQKDIETSEAFYTYQGINYINLNEYQKAIVALNVASKYSASPAIYYYLWQAYMSIGKYESAIKVLNVIEDMLPNHLLPNFYLMNTYLSINDKHNAFYYAKKIVNTKEKIRNQMSEQIKKSAELLLKSN